MSEQQTIDMSSIKDEMHVSLEDAWQAIRILVPDATYIDRIEGMDGVWVHRKTCCDRPVWWSNIKVRWNGLKRWPVEKQETTNVLAKHLGSTAMFSKNGVHWYESKLRAITKHDNGNTTYRDEDYNEVLFIRVDLR